MALEGVVIGTVLGVLTTWPLYMSSPTFGELDAPYPIAWPGILLIVGAGRGGHGHQRAWALGAVAEGMGCEVAYRNNIY